MISFSGHKGIEIAMPVLIAFNVGRKRHHHTVAVSDLDCNSLIGCKYLLFTFVGQDIQTVGIGIPIGRNDHLDNRITADIYNSVHSRLTIYGHGNGIILQQWFRSDLNTLDGIQNLIIIFHYGWNKTFRCSLINLCVFSFILSGTLCSQNRDCFQSRSTFKSNGIVLSIGIFLNFAADTVDYGIAFRTFSQNTISTDSQRFKGNLCFHIHRSTILLGIHSSKRRLVRKHIPVVFRVSINRTQEAVKCRNRHRSTVPASQCEFCIRKLHFRTFI